MVCAAPHPRASLLTRRALLPPPRLARAYCCCPLLPPPLRRAALLPATASTHLCHAAVTHAADTWRQQVALTQPRAYRCRYSALRTSPLKTSFAACHYGAGPYLACRHSAENAPLRSSGGTTAAGAPFRLPNRSPRRCCLVRGFHAAAFRRAAALLPFLHACRMPTALPHYLLRAHAFCFAIARALTVTTTLRTHTLHAHYLLPHRTHTHHTRPARAATPTHAPAGHFTTCPIGSVHRGTFFALPRSTPHYGFSHLTHAALAPYDFPCTTHAPTAPYLLPARAAFAPFRVRTLRQNTTRLVALHATRRAFCLPSINAPHRHTAHRG